MLLEMVDRHIRGMIGVASFAKGIAVRGDGRKQVAAAPLGVIGVHEFPFGALARPPTLRDVKILGHYAILRIPLPLEDVLLVTHHRTVLGYVERIIELVWLTLPHILILLLLLDLIRLVPSEKTGLAIIPVGVAHPLRELIFAQLFLF